MSNVLQLNLAFALGIITIIYLVLGKPKIHALVGLIIASVLMGLASGLGFEKTITAIGDGVAATAKWILLPVSFGVMLGKLLEVTGAAQKMAEAFIRFTGEKRAPWALAFTGWIVSFPVFTDTGYIILNPLAKALSQKTKINMLYMGLALCLGLWPACLMAPPTPQPVAVAATLGIDIGVMTIAGGLMSFVLICIGMLYVKWISSKISFLPSDRGLIIDERYKEVAAGADISTIATEEKAYRKPGAVAAFMCIVIPVILLMTSTFAKVVFPKGHLAIQVFGFIGEPYIAILIGVLMSMYWLASSMSSETRLKWMEEALSSAGMVVCITAAGGALGSVVRAAGIANTWGKLMVEWGIPAWVLGFVIATLIKAAQGSAMTTGITTSAIVAPLIPSLGIHPLMMALAIGCGSLFCSYFNDSLWWVFVRLTGLDMKEGLKAWTGLSVFLWAASIPLLIILSFFIK
ncbi:MAG: SLC13 family permease [Peptococcaceae bacterium]|jgi:GntP family gluconate:H+ symporter|nr:GntP family permease [Peptococcaceae bacterium]MDH7525486.1 SLC13 family permease [Peptococcaceae bacterium]